MSPYEKVGAERAAELEAVGARVIEVLQGLGFSASLDRSPGRSSRSTLVTMSPAVSSWSGGPGTYWSSGRWTA
jgi:hypothetical protein